MLTSPIKMTSVQLYQNYQYTHKNPNCLTTHSTLHRNSDNQHNIISIWYSFVR